ncbi:MAG: hypothetical protein ABI675_07320 [Chitinophagaceae bacterium]
MRPNAFIKRAIAFFLLLVFLQQTGAGLFIHNRLHGKAVTSQSPINKNESTQEINFSCNCIDNFLMPFAEAQDPIVLEKSCNHSKPVDAYAEHAYFTSLIFSALRGPPVFIG